MLVKSGFENLDISLFWLKYTLGYDGDIRFKWLLVIPHLLLLPIPNLACGNGQAITVTATVTAQMTTATIQNYDDHDQTLKPWAKTNSF